jgi:hypothetical protein
MVVDEREYSLIHLGRFCASFQGCETKKSKTDGFLTSFCGNGKTVKEAIKDYARQLSGLLLVKDSHSRARKEIQVPEFI